MVIETMAVVWLAVILALVVIAVLFLVGAAGMISVERTLPDKEDDCICKQTRWAVYADVNCPVHGERR